MTKMRLPTRTFFVTYEVMIEADCPEAAALEALSLMTEPQDTLPCLGVAELLPDGSEGPVVDIDCAARLGGVKRSWAASPGENDED